MEPSLNRAKRSLFTQAHNDPSLAIREMKSVSTHLHRTRDMLHQSLEMMSNIKEGVCNTSGNLRRTSAMYDDYSQKMRKAHMYTRGLKQKEQDNARKIKMAFWLLVGVCIFIVVRRILFPGFYRQLFRVW